MPLHGVGLDRSIPEYKGMTEVFRASPTVTGLVRAAETPAVVAHRATAAVVFAIVCAACTGHKARRREEAAHGGGGEQPG